MMKKLLFAFLVIASVFMPAMAANTQVSAYADLFASSAGGYDADETCYRLIVIKQENTDVNSLAEAIALQSLAGFTASYGPSYGAKETITQDNLNQAHWVGNYAPIDRTTPIKDVYAVSIYQGEAAESPMFQVISCNAAAAQQSGFRFDTKDDSRPSQFTAYRAFAAPEPAAATLSLLAIAGLTARRRRR